MGAAIPLLILNGTGYYIGGELSGASGQDTQKLAALQFASKLHELTMLASIGAIMFTYVRRELAFGEGVPFGAVFAGLHVSNISFLWSVEFWSTIYHEWERRRKKWFLVTLICICCLLGVAVGPSSAVLMRPRLERWPAGGTDFWINATRDELYPKAMEDTSELAGCNVDTGDPSCPSYAWEALARQYFALWPQLISMGSLPQQIFVPGRSSLRRLKMRYRAGVDYSSRGVLPIWGNAYSIATVPNFAIADGLTQLGAYWSFAARTVAPEKRFVFRKDAEFVVSAPQPMVFARCNTQDFNQSFSERADTSFPALPSFSLSNGPGTASRSDARFEPFLYSSGAQPDIMEVIESMLLPDGFPDILWLDDTTLLNGTGSTLNAVVVFPNTTFDRPAVYACSIDSRLVPDVDVKTFWSTPATSEGEPENHHNTGTLEAANADKIMLSAAWARYLNPTIAGENRTILSEMTRFAGMWNSTDGVSPSYNFEPIIEGILAVLTADSIARAPHNATLTGTLKNAISQSDPWEGGWGMEMMPKGGMGQGGSAFEVDEEVKKTATMFTMQAFVTGYAYRSEGKTQIASMAVLAAYVLLALAHFAYASYTGYSSNAWDSAPEIAALAMNSQRTEKLNNTGAGIYHSGVFKELVRVRAKDDNVGMVFNDTNEQCTIIRPNRCYG